MLLLEAGGSPPPAATVPHFAEVVGLAPNINYFFKSVPMTNAALKNGGVEFRRRLIETFFTNVNFTGRYQSHW